MAYKQANYVEARSNSEVSSPAAFGVCQVARYFVEQYIFLGHQQSGAKTIKQWQP